MLCCYGVSSSFIKGVWRLICVNMSQTIKIKFLSWNARGLYERPKRLVVRQAMLVEKLDIVTLQETKLAVIDQSMIREICGTRLETFKMLPAQGTREGIIIAWNQRLYDKILL